MVLSTDQLGVSSVGQRRARQVRHSLIDAAVSRHEPVAPHIRVRAPVRD